MVMAEGVHAERSLRLGALRGAITVDEDTTQAVGEAVAELIEALVSANEIEPSQILSAIFSATADIRSVHPAAIARRLGWEDVPMLCVAEMAVDGALPRCVRVLLHLSVADDRRLRPCYLRGAHVLRPDLPPVR